MPDYKTMYLKLFNAMTDAIELLQGAQQETEELFIDGDETTITPVIPKIENESRGEHFP